MKLEDFVKGARAAGRTRCTLRNPDGRDLYRGPIPDAANLDERARHDAEDRPDGKVHAYEVIIEGDGADGEVFTLRVKGARITKSDDVPDASELRAPSGREAHLARLYIEKDKAMVAMFNAATTALASRDAELWKTRRALLKSDEAAVQRDIVQAITSEDKEKRAMVKDVAGEVVSTVKLLAGRMSPAAASSSLYEFKQSLTREQRVEFARALGPDVFGDLLIADTPERFVDVCMRVAPPVFQALASKLSEEQNKLLLASCGAEFQRRQKEAVENERRKANGAGEAAPS